MLSSSFMRPDFTPVESLCLSDKELLWYSSAAILKHMGSELPPLLPQNYRIPSH